MPSADPSPILWPGVSVIIPTWNGLLLLRTYLPSVAAALARYPGPWECLVVDDGGTDETPAGVSGVFPAARLIRHGRNQGFAAAVNTGLDAAAHPLVLLLNNDIRVEPDFLVPLVRPFTRDADRPRVTLFAVASLQINPAGVHGPPYDGCRRLGLQRGELCFFDGFPPGEDPRGQPGRPTALANGGCTLFSREKLRSLGNFSGLFNPFYYEDAEVSLQALRRGWHMRFEPDSVVWHQPNTSTRLHPGGVNPTVIRNQFFLHWLLLDDPGLWLRHLLWIVPRLISRTLRGDWSFPRGFFRAVQSLPSVRRERRVRARGIAGSTRDILWGQRSKARE